MTPRHSKSRLTPQLLLIGFGSVALLFALPARALELDYTLKATAIGEANGGRDVGLNGNSDDQQASLDLTPWVHAQFSPAWAGFLRIRAFAPTGSILSSGNDSNNAGPTAKVYIGLREAWLEYRGLTSYPGENLRLGRQRIRNPDAQWFDEDVDAVRWNFDTTLLKADLGVGHQFSSYRSDNVGVPFDERDRTYLFASVATDWLPDQLIGARIVHAEDDRSSPAVGTVTNNNTKLTGGSLTWLNLFTDNDAYNYLSDEVWHYWGQGTFLIGESDRARRDVTGTVVATDGGSVHAAAVEAGLRVRPSELPIQVGGAVVYSTGGTNNDSATQYAQTGLQTNYSRFTGTRAQINRFNDAYRVELGNLIAGTAFASYVDGPWDASVIYNHFLRARHGGTVRSDALSVSPVTDARTLGDAFEFVGTRYFGRDTQDSKLAPQENLETSLRLRAALFNPGAAYGPAASLEYRVILELTLWY